MSDAEPTDRDDEPAGIARRDFLRTSGALVAGVALGAAPARAGAEPADPFVALDATAQAELVRRGEVASIELVDAAIARIESLDPALNSFNHRCFERARARARGMLPDGPFRGVPFAIKDLENYAGEPTTYGSRLFVDNVAEENGEIVDLSLDAGFVILGKTNTPEFGLLATTESLLLGPTRNPWNLERTSGGSSGGAAAAVAAGLVPFAQASDGGGSIRNPASCCGLVGLKPSRGRIRTLGRTLPGDISVRFAVSRSVRDSARFLAFAQDRAKDAALAPVADPGGPRKRRLRVGLSIQSATGVEPHPHVVAEIERTAALLAELGHEVVPVVHPVDAEEFIEHFLCIWSYLPGQLEDRAWIAGLLDGRLVSAADVLEPWTIGLAEWLDRRDSDAVERAVAYLARVQRDYEGLFQQVDVQLTPVLADPPVPLGEQAPDLPFDTLYERVVRYSSFTPPYNAAGAPALSLPLGLSPDGLPIGSHIGARLGAEGTLLALAYELERARPWAHRWPAHSAMRVRG